MMHGSLFSGIGGLFIPVESLTLMHGKQIHGYASAPQKGLRIPLP